MSTTRFRLLRNLGAGATVAALLGSMAACGSSTNTAASISSTTAVSAAAQAASASAEISSSASDPTSAGRTTVIVAAHSNGAGVQTSLDVTTVAEIRAKLPKATLDSGKLVIGVGALPAGFPPLAFVGDDQRTLTGAEPDFGRLVAAVLGLEPDVQNSTWDNLFVGIDSGRTDVGFSNITDTEKRKEKYDFATYRQDNLGFEVLKSSSWNFADDYQNLAGKTVAVGSGTNQEKLLLEWQNKLKAAGKTVEIKYFPTTPATYLALASGKIDAYFGPNPGIAYHVTQDAATPSPTRNAGKVSGAGTSLQGLIAGTTKKGSGLAEPVAEAINYLIKHGQYAKWLAAWNLSNEAVPTSLVNPPGLPLTNS